MPSCVARAVSVGEFVSVGASEVGADAAPASIALARPKSSTFTVPSGAHLDVRGLEVAVDDALLVRGLERLGDLARDRQRLVERQSAPRSIRCGQVLALDQLHHERT